jgi:hypothetical protein
MAEFKNNLYKMQGVIYAMPVRTAEDKKGKNGGKPWEFPSVILEVKRTYKDKEFVELPEFDLGYGVSLTEYAIGDLVEITFSLSGKKIGNWHKTTAKAIYIRHADISSGGVRSVGGDTWEERRQKEKAEKDIFTPPNPYEDDDEPCDLPF